MTTDHYVIFEDRGIVSVSGEDRVAFLQGLVSNDVAKVSPERAIYSAFLTAQGKFLHDFFLIDTGQALLLDCERDRAEDLKKRLSLYKLRSKVTLENASERFRVGAAFGPNVRAKLDIDGHGAAQTFAGGVLYLDPRLREMGARFVLPLLGPDVANDDPLLSYGFVRAEPEAYHQLRIANGLPDGSRDMIVDKAILLENGFDELHAVDWKKGCYIGQELTARTKYRGLIKKRLMPVAVAGPLPPPGAVIELDGKEAGEMRSGFGAQGLALLRLEAVEAALNSGLPLTAGDAKLTPIKPDWASF